MGSKSGVRDLQPRRYREVVAHRPEVGRRIRRRREKRGRYEIMPVARTVAETLNPTPAPDPVDIAVFALERLSHASMRAAFTGKEVQVSVPDSVMASIFRSALAQTGRSRATDRLIRVVVDPDSLS